MRRTAVIVITAVAACASLFPASGAVAAPSETATNGSASRVEHAATPVRGGTAPGVPGQAKTATVRSNGIYYHGGPVMNTAATAYVIWYGNWAGDTATTILPGLLSGLSGSPYYNINTTYADGANRPVPNQIVLGPQVNDAYSQGSKNLSDGQIASIVSNAITTGKLPKDAAGVYFVLTSVDVSKSGFLSSYCGWHTHGAIAGADIKYAFVGNPGINPACSMQTSLSPNGNVGADAMASIIAHELEESTSDPDLNAWYDRRGYENADKCAWTFGTTYTVPNGSKANMALGGRQYLIQRNWVNASGGYCSLSY
jgi:hypothetical protein